MSHSNNLYDKPKLEIKGLEELIKNYKYIDHILGCLYGSCIGEAYGLSTIWLQPFKIDNWYQDKEKFIEFPNYKDYIESKWEKGDWGYDCDHMILILQSLINGSNKTNISGDSNTNNNSNSSEIDKCLNLFTNKLKEYIDNRGFKELGDCEENKIIYCPKLKTTQIVVKKEYYLKDPMASKYVWINRDRFPNDSGSIMRSPILSCLNFLNDKFLLEYSIKFCKVTHYDPLSIISTIINNLNSTILKYYYNNNKQENQQEDDLKIILSNLIKEIDSDKFLNISSKVYETFKMGIKGVDMNKIVKFYLHFNQQDCKGLLLSDALQNGFPLYGLGSSIYSLKKFNQYLNNSNRDLSFIFRKVLDEIIREGGDNNGARSGALLGSLIGYSNLPKDMLLSLPNKSWFDNQVVEFINLVHTKISNGNIEKQTLNQQDEKLILNSIYNNETLFNAFIDFNDKDYTNSYNKDSTNNINNNNNNNKTICCIQ